MSCSGFSQEPTEDDCTTAGTLATGITDTATYVRTGGMSSSVSSVPHVSLAAVFALLVLVSCGPKCALFWVDPLVPICRKISMWVGLSVTALRDTNWSVSQAGCSVQVITRSWRVKLSGSEEAFCYPANTFEELVSVVMDSSNSVFPCLQILKNAFDVKTRLPTHSDCYRRKSQRIFSSSKLNVGHGVTVPASAQQKRGLPLPVRGLQRFAEQIIDDVVGLDRVQQRFVRPRGAPRRS